VAYRRAPDGSLSIEVPGSVQRIRRDAQGAVLVELGNGTSVLSSYDDDARCRGRVVWRRNGAKVALWSVRYTYSAEGELRRVDDDARGVTEYAYDEAHRLVGASGPSGAVTFALDAAGNILEKPGLPRVELTEGNRLSKSGPERFAYEGRNHLAEHVDAAGRTTRYQYDSLDHLVGVTWSDRDEAWTAGYDGLDRRWYQAMGGRRTEYFWDNDRLAAEIGPTGALRVYVYPGPEALVPILFVDYESAGAEPEAGRPYYVIHDQVGVPLHIEDQAGRVVWKAEHVDPYGLVTVAPGASISCALRFPGHLFDEETGLHDNRHRSYSPRLGRYLQSDPAGQSGGVNLYAYPANPLVDVDVLGLFACKIRKFLGLRDKPTEHAERYPGDLEHHSLEELAKMPGDHPDQIRARMAIAENFYHNAPDFKGREDEIPSHLEGIDYTKPVSVQSWPYHKAFFQYQWPSKSGEGRRGNYLAARNTPAQKLGISGWAKPDPNGPLVRKKVEQYVLPPDTEVLVSTAAPITDKWSAKGTPQDTPGGGQQVFLGDKGKLTPIFGQRSPWPWLSGAKPH
jgi:RHS repeat-associated protein